jgi:hypothetical protein
MSRSSGCDLDDGVAIRRLQTLPNVDNRDPLSLVAGQSQRGAGGRSPGSDHKRMVMCSLSRFHLT